jgi:hypothetical protein
MPDSISDVQYITVVEACKILPGRPHRNTIIRWFDRGYRGVRLKCWRCGNRRVTSISAIDEFIAATTGSQGPVPTSTSPGHQHAESQLDVRGVKPTNHSPGPLGPENSGGVK